MNAANIHTVVLWQSCGAPCDVAVPADVRQAISFVVSFAQRVFHGYP